MRIENISVIFQVWYSEDIGGFEYEVVTVNGRFELVGMAELLKRCVNERFIQIEQALEKKDCTEWDVEVEVLYNEPETQYGTGYGDILTLPGYYYIGKVLNVLDERPWGSTAEGDQSTE